MRYLDFQKIAANDEGVVVVVDDDQMIRHSLCRVIKGEGIEVISFSSAEELMGSDLPDQPLCILLDLKLPGMGGLELQRWLAQGYQGVTILFISGTADVKSTISAFRNGAIDFLPKPVHPTVLSRSLDRGLHQARQARARDKCRAEMRTRYDRLTPREREVFEYLLTGQMNKQIAYHLGTTEKTIKVHRSRIKKKLRLRSPLEMVRTADLLGIDPPACR